jgi:hypothetical protein
MLFTCEILITTYLKIGLAHLFYIIKLKIFKFDNRTNVLKLNSIAPLNCNFLALTFYTDVREIEWGGMD